MSIVLNKDELNHIYQCIGANDKTQEELLNKIWSCIDNINEAERYTTQKFCIKVVLEVEL